MVVSDEVELERCLYSPTQHQRNTEVELGLAISATQSLAVHKRCLADQSKVDLRMRKASDGN